MSYEDKQRYSREELLVMRAKDAKAIFTSETATPEEKKYFLMRNPWYLEAGVEGKWSDDLKETDLMALVVLDDVPHEVMPTESISRAELFGTKCRMRKHRS
jgi:hypothetical protein